ncbi:MAG: helix-turn-helix transcriptional regulator [Lacrimispora sp.]
MNHIGNVIREYRGILHMSRHELAENICSEKYLYMVETGKRTPSCHMVRTLGDKMRVDLCKYSEYFDCLNPVQVRSFIEKFYIYRRDNNYAALKEATEEALKIEDYHKDPWRYEIQLNYLITKVFGERDFISPIPQLTAVISEMEGKKVSGPCLISLYVLLSTCYQMARDIDNARNVVTRTMEAIKGKQENAKYVQVAAAAKLNEITMHHLAGEFEAVIEEAHALFEYENEMSYREYTHYGYFFLAFAYYESGRKEKGMKWFHKALSAMLVTHKAEDMYYIAAYDIFKTMLTDPMMSKDLLHEFMNEYDPIGFLFS